MSELIENSGDYNYNFRRGRKSIWFTDKGKQRVEIYDGFVLVNADVIIADGTHYNAVLGISESDDGEHCETHFLINGVDIESSHPNLCKVLGKTKEQIWPYIYKYRVALECDDIHVGEDGWSDSYGRIPDPSLVLKMIRNKENYLNIG